MFSDTIRQRSNPLIWLALAVSISVHLAAAAGFAQLQVPAPAPFTPVAVDGNPSVTIQIEDVNAVDRQAHQGATASLPTG